MNLVILFIIILVLAVVYVQYKKQEGFSFEMKTSLDGKMFKSINRGAASITKGIASQARKMSHAASSMVPFKHKIREWNRKMRGRNM